MEALFVCLLVFIFRTASKVIMPYGKLITHFTTGGHDIFITCPAKSMHLEPFGLSVHAFCGTGDENIIPTCRSAASVVTECNVTNCDTVYCNDNNCSQCLDGYFWDSAYTRCDQCYLYCRPCSSKQCYDCFTPECSSEICSHENCSIAGCAGNTSVNCDSCPDGYFLGNNNTTCYRCNNVNCKCSTADNCIECLPGHYNIGNVCNKTCPVECITCIDSVVCGECVPGKYGDTCEQDCITRCVNETCDKQSGICEEECPSGQYLDANSKCQNCSTRCETCINSTICITCKKSHYWNPVCRYDCTGCLNKCNRSYGCSAGCTDPVYFLSYSQSKQGYECIRCPESCQSCNGSTHCTACNTGFWGSACQHSCNNCSGDCDKITGCGRNCIIGFYPFEADGGYECKPCFVGCENCSDTLSCNVCEEGYYVNDTSHCSSCPLNCKESKCDRTNGTCTKGCASGYTGHRCDEKCPDNCVECDQLNSSHCYSCQIEFYGDSCEKNCSENCKTDIGFHKCHKVDGSCLYGCNDGFWTATCTAACARECADQMCNETNGVCLNGCTANYHGNLCLSECSPRCLNMSNSTRVCNETTGDCVGQCQDGWYASNCSLRCNVNDNCYQRRCYQHNGTCELECVTGSTDSRCIEETSPTSIPTTQTGTGGDADDGGNIAGLAGAGVGAAVVIIIVLVIVVLLIRRRRRAVNKHEIDGILLDNPKHSLAIENNEYATINDTKSRNGVDTVILNEKSPVIMTKSPDDIDVSQNPNVKKSPNISGTQKRKDATRSNDNEANNVNQEENNFADVVKHDAKTDSQTPVLNNPLYNAGGDYVPGIKDTPMGAEKQKDVEPNRYSPSRKTNEPVEKAEIIGNHTREDVDEDGDTYYNAIGKRVQVPELADYVNSKDYESIVNEFEKLLRGLLKPCSAAKMSRNTEKNRYRQIYPYDESRIVLKDGGNDYVNASYIEGFNKPKEYIASAGPFKRKDKTETTTDFWRMIWQEKCETIVMLTKCFENTEQKCDQYWPELGENKWYGKLHVTCVTEDQYADFTVRSFIVTQDETTMNTRQIHFTAWPDKGVPTDVTCIIEYRQKVRSLHKDKASPILVHCSAGIGRTGTFIALDIQTFVGETKGYVDIFGCVSNLRQQRVNLVQTLEQYEYLHHAILHALTFDCKSIPAEDFITYYSRIIKKKDGYIQIELQFKNLTSTLDALSVEEKYAISRNKTLKDKNRDGADIPGDENRFRLLEDRKPGSSDYINAVFLNGFKTCNRFIVAQTPMSTTVVDFLSMIHQTDCSCVITMEETDLQDKTVGVLWPGDNQVIKHGIFQVRCNESKTNENYTLKNLTLVRRTGKKDEAKDVNLFIFTNWPRDTAVPKSSDSLIQFIKDVDKANSHDEDERPILVHCMTGAERSCLYCAVSVLIEKLEIEHEVSVVNTLRQIKSRRRSAFPTLDQYKFCHQAVISYLQTFDTYSNFELRSHPSNEAAADAVYATVKK